MRFDLVTRASPEQVLEAMTDFTDRRLRTWSTTLDSRLHVEWSTHPVKPLDKVAIFLIHHTMNHLIARSWRGALDRFALT